ncbi:MAG TPA: phosphoserine transaminase [Candidatus Wallbacteria bacterium]|nr:phosphoserine transaminase [Candidatus Wallbacteria bacterium]
MTKRIHNFNAGPAALPLEVLEEAQRDFIDYKGNGLSVLEMSHRDKVYDNILKEAEKDLKELYSIPDNYTILFLQGGATLQFAMVPMNLLADGRSADYINTGVWATKAIEEAQKLGKKVNVIASSEDKAFTYIPDKFKTTPDAAYLHITSNNTIRGTEWQSYPDTGPTDLVCDMSSDFCSRPVDIKKFALIYAGAQKNVGPAGCTVVIIRNDLLARSPKNIPTMCNYSIMAKEPSLYNTPPCFSIYIIGLVLKWLKKNGGLAKMQEVNVKKAKVLYDRLDKNDFYRGTVEKNSRSLMNIPFRLKSEELEEKFIKEAKAAGMIGLKGHRSVGGVRASFYNALPIESAKALVDFMDEFEKKNS